MIQSHEAHDIISTEEQDLLGDFVFDQMAGVIQRFAEGEHSLSVSQVMEVVAMFADVAEEVFPDGDAKEGLADLLKGGASDLLLESAADFILIALADLKQH